VKGLFALATDEEGVTPYEKRLQELEARVKEMQTLKMEDVS